MSLENIMEDRGGSAVNRREEKSSREVLKVLRVGGE